MTSRTNNLCESFHNSLSYSIEHANQKLAINIKMIFHNMILMKLIILPGKDENNNINLNKNKEDEFINLIDMHYKKSFKRSYNDLTRFNELYDIKLSENQINNEMNNSPKLKLI